MLSRYTVNVDVWTVVLQILLINVKREELVQNLDESQNIVDVFLIFYVKIFVSCAFLCDGRGARMILLRQNISQVYAEGLFFMFFGDFGWEIKKKMNTFLCHSQQRTI